METKYYGFVRLTGDNHFHGMYKSEDPRPVIAYRQGDIVFYLECDPVEKNPYKAFARVEALLAARVDVSDVQLLEGL